MKLGLDFYDTITVSPRIYGKLAEAILAAGGEVHIITAVGPKNVERVKTAVSQSKVPHTELHIVEFTDYDQIPVLKAKVAGKLELDMMIDDRKDVCKIMYSSHILGIRSLGGVL